MSKKPAYRIIRLLIAPAMVISIFAAFVVERVLPYYGIKPYRMIAAEHAWRFPKGHLPENYGIQGRKVSLQTKDSLTLKAWFIESNLDTTKGTVIILHGISSCKESQFGRAKILADNGFNSVALDLRAHGESGGEYCTFGFYEKYDIQTVVDSVVAINGKNPVGIWGASLGGAVALQSMELDPRIAFGVVESTFDEFEKVAVEYGADLMLGIRAEWLTCRVLGKSGDIARFAPEQVKPVESAANIDRPILFMHGGGDDKIPIEFNRRNYEAAKSPEKQWITVPGAGHNNLWVTAGADLQEQVLAFLSKATGSN